MGGPVLGGAAVRPARWLGARPTVDRRPPACADEKASLALLRRTVVLHGAPEMTGRPDTPGTQPLELLEGPSVSDDPAPRAASRGQASHLRSWRDAIVLGTLRCLHLPRSLMAATRPRSKSADTA